MKRLLIVLLVAAGAAHATTVRVHYAAAPGALAIDSDKGPARATGTSGGTDDPVWTFTWPDALGAVALKPTLHGQPAKGGRYLVPAGASVDIYPFFRASAGTVEIMADVVSPQLHNSRALRIYYPPSYRENPAKRYPVLYMHDGQNLFDAKTAAFGVAWNIGATIDRLVAAGSMEEVIVVGIDNTGERIAEYTPCCDPKHGGGKLAAYEAFIADTVKPLIDRRLRTLPGREHTAIMGSSLGGLASVAIAAHRPQLFSMAAGLSSSFWWDGGALIKQPPGPLPVRWYLDAGTIDDGLADSEAMRDALLTQGYVDGADLMFYTAPGGKHNEASWRARVDKPLRWFFPWNR